MNAMLHKVRQSTDHLVYVIQAPAVAGSLTRSGGVPSEALMDRMANAFASAPVANFEFQRAESGKWYVKVLLKAKAPTVAARAAAKAEHKCTHVDTLDTSVRGTHECPQCMGTGRYVVGLHNGEPKFGTGICYRCKGKGRTTEIDRRRNLRYLEWSASRAMAADLNPTSAS